MGLIVDNFFTFILILNILLSFVIVFRERKETAQTLGMVVSVDVYSDRWLHSVYFLRKRDF